jgi:hypothetical protein
VVVNAPKLLVVTIVGVTSVVVSNLIVTLVNGRRLEPDIESAVPAGPVDDNKEAVGVVPAANAAPAVLTVSDAVTMLLPVAVVGTVNALLNVPVAVTGTVTVGANATLLNLIVAVLPGIKWVPVTVTDWPATPLDVDSEIAGVVTVNAADAICVPSDTATVPIPDGDPGTVNLTLTGIPPADVDVTVTGDVVTGVPLNVNVSTCVAAKLVPDTVT